MFPFPAHLTTYRANDTNRITLDTNQRVEKGEKREKAIFFAMLLNFVIFVWKWKLQTRPFQAKCYMTQRKKQAASHTGYSRNSSLHVDRVIFNMFEIEVVFLL